MRIKLRRFYVLIICIVLICTPCFAQTYTEGAFYYELEGESITITGYFGREEEIYVPEIIAGYPVNGIGDGAFAKASTVKVIHLPGTITFIGENAFLPGQTVVYADSHPVAQNGSANEGDNDSRQDENLPETSGQQSDEDVVVITVGDVSETGEGSTLAEPITIPSGSGAEVTLSDDDAAEAKSEETDTAEEPPESVGELSLAEESASIAEQKEESDTANQRLNSRTTTIIIIVCVCVAAVIIGVIAARKKKVK